MLTKRKLRREIQQYLGIIVGGIFFAIGYSWFLLPYDMAPGGVGGIAQIFNHFFGFPIGITMIAINIPLFVISFLLIGKSFGGKSIYGMLITSLLTDALNLQNLHRFGFIPDLQKYTFFFHGRTVYAMIGPTDIYLAAIAGSVMLGIGLGIVFRFRGSTGGTDIPVALIKQRAGISIGTGYWIVETAIIFAVGIALQDLKLIIWGYINLFISTKITDLASEGLPYVKGVYIISPQVKAIRDEIFERIDRGVTFIKAEGGYSGKPMDMLFCVLNRRQVPELTDIVKDIDKDAFMIVTDVYDVLGFGFRSRQINLADNTYNH